MKKIILLFLFTQIGLIACGSPTPFQRGLPQETLKPAPKPTHEEQGMSDTQYFDEKVAPLIKQDCGMCHGDRATYAKALDLVVPGNPEQSLLYQKATGATRHAGGAPWDPASAAAGIVKTWILNIGKTISNDNL